MTAPTGSIETLLPVRTGEDRRMVIVLATALLVTVPLNTQGQLAAAAAAGLCALLVLTTLPRLIVFLRRNPLLLAMPLLIGVSFLWSDQPFLSLRLGIQEVATLLAAIAIAATCRERTVQRILMIALGLTVVGCILHGGTGPSEQGPVLIGYMGSKDPLALVAYLGALVAFSVTIDRESGRAWRLFALILMPVCGVVAASLHAATAVISLALALSLFLAISMLRRFPALRRGVVLVTLVAGPVLLLGILDFWNDLFNAVMKALGKSSTITGRTILWAKGLDLFAGSPLFGLGYRSFWVGESNSAFSLLLQMGQTDGRGFHFHQQFIEFAVDTGMVGLTTFLTLLTVSLKRAWACATMSSSRIAPLWFSILAVYCVRFFGETVSTPFNIDVIVLFLVITILARQSEALRRDTARPVKGLVGALHADMLELNRRPGWQVNIRGGSSPDR
ncbi:O-antigen ligase family protein [Phaeospirillum tilakii]|uniref:O-antigen ligase family protein n=1 Tax=Phaeospirillum tilakii TaxID=741673 RepID=A0ABW5CC93_9PROT